MEQLSETYKDAPPDELFWVDQPMDKFVALISGRYEQLALLKDGGTENKVEIMDEDDCYAGTITNVFTIKEFETKYNI